MKIADYIVGKQLELIAGGPGSGCHGENCGRPAGSGGGAGSAREGGSDKESGKEISIGHVQGLMKDMERVAEKIHAPLNQSDAYETVRMKLEVNEMPSTQEIKDLMNDFERVARKAGAPTHDSDAFQEVSQRLPKGSWRQLTDGPRTDERHSLRTRDAVTDFRRGLKQAGFKSAGIRDEGVGRHALTHERFTHPNGHTAKITTDSTHRGYGVVSGDDDTHADLEMWKNR